MLAAMRRGGDRAAGAGADRARRRRRPRRRARRGRRRLSRQAVRARRTRRPRSAPSLRRHAGRAEPRIELGSLAIDPATHEVSVDGAPLALSAREFALLEALAARPGAILSRAQLEERLYGWNEAVDSNAVEVHLSTAAAQARRRGRSATCAAWAGCCRGPATRRDAAAAEPAAADELDPSHAAAVARRRPRARVHRGHRRHVPARARRGRRRCSTSSSRSSRRRSPACRWRHRRCRAASTRTARWSSRCGIATASRSIARRAGARRRRAAAPASRPSRRATARGASTASLAAGELVQVAQPLSVRDELAASLALRTIVPWLVAMPLVALLLWFAIARALAPLDRVAAAVSRRNPRELAPLAATGWPREVQPLVDALNALLGRLDAALAAQRDLRRRRRARAAHAAHRGAPAGAARRARDRRAGARAALAAMKGGLARATRLVRAAARAGPRRRAGAASAGDDGRPRGDRARRRRRAGGRRGGARRRPRPRRRRRRSRCAVSGDAAALTTLLSNLVDNAVRYTPAGGEVDVVVETRDGRPVLVVRDTGPGIPGGRARARVRALRPRPRRAGAPGSGLGLAIVRRIAERHGARRRAGRRARRARSRRHGDLRRPSPGALIRLKSRALHWLRPRASARARTQPKESACNPIVFKRSLVALADRRRVRPRRDRRRPPRRSAGGQRRRRRRPPAATAAAGRAPPHALTLPDFADLVAKHGAAVVEVSVTKGATRTRPGRRRSARRAACRRSSRRSSAACPQPDGRRGPGSGPAAARARASSSAPTA